ncbi:PC3 endoprotease variant B isoform X1 [Biomphalaria glabrata]|nr:PC3 endoprotease variant B isoform X1 [Biomphalaria glabrata]
MLLMLSGIISILPVLLPSAAAEHIFLNQFAVQLKHGDKANAEDIAREYGFLVKAEIASIAAYIFEHQSVPPRSKRSSEQHINLLRQDTRIQHVQQEVVLHRVKRHPPARETSRHVAHKDVDIPSRANISFSDPKFKNMWYLVNEGFDGDIDMNIAVVWEKGFTGKGIVVSILDDGIDYTHPDLANNYDPKASTDLNDRTDLFHDPMPNKSDIDNSHGTRCAGEVAAAANNGICGVGVAFQANIAGVRLLDGIITDGLEAEALTFKHDYIDIYSASWGPSDDGAVMAGPGHLTVQAFQYGVDHGRQGLGSIFVWATGNGGLHLDNCNADGYVSRPETLAVGSVNNRGKSSFYSENCTAILVVVPSGVDIMDGQNKSKVITTDINNGCLETFEGTSSAAPLAAGCIANVLQANRNLTWRDIQHITVRAARIPSADDSWIINGAGHHVSPQFGFGLMDCGQMVHLAQTWKAVPQRKLCQLASPKIVNRRLSKLSNIQEVITVDGCQSEKLNRIDSIEHVQVYIKMYTEDRGGIMISLTSPSLTRSVLLAPRPKDSFHGDWEYTFMTVHHWDENPVGDWSIDIHSTTSSSYTRDSKIKQTSSRDVHINKALDSVAVVFSWNLILWGTFTNRQDTGPFTNHKATYPTVQNLEALRKRELELSKKVILKKSNNQPIVEKMSSNSLIGVFSENNEETPKDHIQKRILEKNLLNKYNLNEIEALTDNITDILVDLFKTST